MYIVVIFQVHTFEYDGIVFSVISFIAVREDSYFLVGQALAVSMVHGGPSPGFFSMTLFDCLVKGPANVSLAIEDVSDLELQENVQRVSYTSSLIIKHT